MSVVACTYNRGDLVRDVLQDLQAQVLPPGIAAQFILVNNNSRDHTAAVVEEINSAGGPPIEYVLETKQGLSAARNAGIRAATGDILLFTDDDVRLPPEWVARLSAPFADPRVMAAAGRIEPLWPERVPRWVGPLDEPRFPGVVGRFHVGAEPRWLGPADPRPLGANMAFRRELFEEIGGFREDLGRAGGNLAGGEDMEFYSRVLSRYGRISYVPDALVRHRVTERMLHRRYFLRCLAGGGRSLADYEPWQELPRLFGIPRHLLRRMAADTAALLGRALLLDEPGAFFHLGRLVHHASYAAAVRNNKRTGLPIDDRSIGPRGRRAPPGLPSESPPSAPLVGVSSAATSGALTKPTSVPRAGEHAGTPSDATPRVNDGHQGLCYSHPGSAVPNTEHRTPNTEHGTPERLNARTPERPTPNAQRPLVSIVVPTYNRAHLLPAALESCLHQTYDNLELIVVDDGSKDATPEVVSEIARRDPRVRYVRQENGKIPRALNTGFRHARGELLTWTSDDNLFEPDAIEVMAGFLQSHPDAGLVYCDMKAIDEAGNVLTTLTRPAPSEIGRANVVAACFMYRRSVAERVGEYDPEAFLAEDYDYWLRISKVAPLAHLSGTAPYRFRIHPASLTSTREVEAELQAARVRARHAETETERRALMAAGHCAAGMELRKIGRHGEALRHYAAAVRLHPIQMEPYRGIVLALLRHRTRMPDHAVRA